MGSSPLFKQEVFVELEGGFFGQSEKKVIELEKPERASF